MLGLRLSVDWLASIILLDPDHHHGQHTSTPIPYSVAPSRPCVLCVQICPSLSDAEQAQVNQRQVDALTQSLALLLLILERETRSGG